MMKGPSASTGPSFRELDREEIDAVLRRNRFGRLAFRTDEGVDIEPIGYAFVDGMLCGRTTPGTKLEALAHRPWVAFEVDEVTGPFDWTSVVLKGSFYLIPAGPSVQQQQTYAHTLNAIRSVAPSTLTDEDPVPERAILFRIYIDDVRGRSARSKP
jgi:nitroimidazol reductase NimA-like FMN-containing flavoprotein (pyridoxamine 5'-phosphate oxidase superfamily)